MSGEALKGGVGGSSRKQGGGGIGGSKGEQTSNWEVNHRTGDGIEALRGGRVATSTQRLAD